jgi:predicted enzyme related to lactoylglutathione lyase
MSTGVSIATRKFVWHEQVSSDPLQAQAFYTQLFGWEIEIFKPGEFDYAAISSGGATHGGFSKAMAGAPPPHWLGHVRVESVDETIERAKDAGGDVVFGPMDMEDVGRFAILTDPQGAFFATYQPVRDMPPSEGVFVWDELATTDVDAAASFYGDVFGWTAEDMGSDFGGYRMFKAGETQVGGLMKNPNESAPPVWVPYVGTEDVDGTSAKAKELGANLYMGPMDVPTVGRIAVLGDPQGAVFGLFKPSS